jgi:hypothetical protein
MRLCLAIDRGGDGVRRPSICIHMLVKTRPGPARPGRKVTSPSLEKGTQHSRVSEVESVYVNTVMLTRLLRFVLRVCRNLRSLLQDRSTRSRRLLCFIREGNVSDY